MAEVALRQDGRFVESVSARGRVYQVADGAPVAQEPSRSRPARSSQCQRILDFLSDGEPHSVREIHDACGYSRLNSRVSELRARGHRIECAHVPGGSGSDGFTYRYLGTLHAPPAFSPPPPSADGASSAPEPAHTTDAAPAATAGGSGALQLTLADVAT